MAPTSWMREGYAMRWFARDYGLAGLQRLAQGIEHARLELGQLIEKQHAEMRKAHLAGTRAGAAADQRRHARRMMRRAEGSLGGELAAHQLARERVHHRDLEHLLGRERRQDRGEPCGEHRLAGARRPDHQKIVAARGRHLENALGAFLALDVAQVGERYGIAIDIGLGPRQRLQALEVIDERQQVRGGQDVDVLAGPGGFRAARGRTDQPLADGVGADGGRKRPGHGADRAVERQLADGGEAGDGVGRDRLHRDHHGEQDRQVELAALLGQVGRRQVHGDVLEGHAEPDSVQGVADALAAFRDGLVGQPDDHECLLAGRDAHLHLDRTGLDADERERGNMPVHAAPMRNADSLAGGVRRRKNIKGTTPVSPEVVPQGVGAHCVVECRNRAADNRGQCLFVTAESD
jgi:hypothetical protein